MKIVIIDYDMGNIRSISNALRHVCDHDVVVSEDPVIIAESDALILPGVGAYRDAMEHLRARNLIEVLRHEVMEKQKPILGICLGMQLMFESSEEGKEETSSEIEGLGWIPGHVVRLNPGAEFRVPHVGWNDLEVSDEDEMWNGLSHDKNHYFVHSYYAKCDPKYVIAEFDYDKKFTASVRLNNIIGMQFHPEKSQKVGANALKNFVGYMEKNYA